MANYDKKFMHLFQVSLHMYPLPQDALVPSVITHILLSKTIQVLLLTFKSDLVNR